MTSPDETEWHESPQLDSLNNIISSCQTQSLPIVTIKRPQPKMIQIVTTQSSRVKQESPVAATYKVPSYQSLSVTALSNRNTDTPVISSVSIPNRISSSFTSKFSSSSSEPNILASSSQLQSCTLISSPQSQTSITTSSTSSSSCRKSYFNTPTKTKKQKSSSEIRTELSGMLTSQHIIAQHQIEYMKAKDERDKEMHQLEILQKQEIHSLNLAEKKLDIALKEAKLKLIQKQLAEK